LLSQYLSQKRIPKLVVVAADLGFAKKARDFAASLNAPVAFVEKRRRRNNTSSLTIIGNVKGKNALIVDDEVDQGTTLAGAAALLRQRGALDVYAAFVHATFSGAAVSRLVEAKFAEIVCTDTEPTVYREDVCAVLPNLTVLSVGPYLAKIIGAVHSGLSVGKTVDDARFTAP
jgi:ribose-phosphate pyrophosphokinase